MKNTVLLLVFLFATIVGYAQKEKKATLNKDTNLIEVVYYHDNGEVSQEGTFDLAGKLHGEWISYNEAGEKTSLGTYYKGQRTGKWFFWADGNMKEVEFKDNAIASVVDTKNKSGVVVKD
ncbi:nicotinic acid mononucleotide adenyltransferase [Flavobacteriaceae bacterium TP-CH-4]|uniref:Nicotinic acid mononucleotide adenyltransferase n=1 Tax=Pelagihabitans pacificus TaxID=2696054 RepID=A0A967AZI6_9FLAO|nr:nicotinic acid mononucleotide adenyltransferase [Pelagihabitans pacificus]NHF60417.1 nicotinic acid mononucleotide adenyltransferase [Pelagihabitans pacificus]